MTLIVKMPHVFGPRWTEWLGAMALVFAGLGLLHPYHAFDNPSFAIFDFLDEVYWGGFMLFVGVLRFTALVINGRRKRVTPWMRLTGAVISFMIFAGFSVGLLLSGVMSTWPGAWPVLAVMEYINIVRSTSDARVGYGGSN